MNDEQRKDWDRLTRTLGAGFLARWDQHDPGSLEEEVGPAGGVRPGDRDGEQHEAWFD